MLVWLCLVLFQSLTPSPSVAEAGQVVHIVASDGRDQTCVGIVVRAIDPDGVARELGLTDPSGSVSFTPDRVGDWWVSSSSGGVDLVTPLAVVASPRRGALALLGGLAAILAVIAVVLALRTTARDRPVV